MVLAGWTVIDKDPDATFTHDDWFAVTGVGGTAGTFTVSSAAWSAFSQLAIGLVVGGGQTDPKWVVFLLPVGETSGLWSDLPIEGGGLSHANLYGIGGGITAVPEPATLFMVGSGLAGLVMRRRKAACLPQ